MEKYLEVGRVNLKHNLMPHILIAFIFSSLTPLLMGVKNLDGGRTARVLELYIALIGIILLVPIFLPEEDKNIKDLVESKYVSIITVYSVRLFEALIILTIFIGAFIFVLHHGNCTFPWKEYFFGTMAEAIFLGGMGVFIYGIFDNIAIGYMVPLIYYISNYGGGKSFFKNFYIFSMAQGSYTEKYYLAIAGAIFITLGILWGTLKREFIIIKYNFKN